jgi:O-antigen/teichoic acid export membrane protein
MAVGTIIIGLYIMEGDYGLYAIALIPATTLLLFQDWGVGAALTRICAQGKMASKEADLRKVIIVGLVFEVVTGLLLTVFSLFSASFLASRVFGKPESAFLIVLVSVSILSTSVFSAVNSVFIGFEQMKLVSLALLCQAIAQTVVSPLLVYLGYGALGAVLGYTFASIAASLFSVVLFFFAIFRKIKPVNTSDTAKFSETLKPMLHYGIPLAIATILSGLLTQFYSFMMATLSNTVMIGNYKVATNFTILLTFFSVPISTVLFPAFSKLNPKKEKHLLKTVFASSVKYTAFLLIPATMALIVLSQPIIGTLYGAKWSFAPPFLALGVLGNLLVFFGNISIANLLSAVGETKLLMKMNILTILIGVPLAFLLIPSMGITGVIIGPVIAGAPSLFLSLYFVWKHYEIKLDFKASTKIFLASSLATAIVYLFLNFFTVAYWLKLAAGLILFITVYLHSAPLIGAINQVDVSNLRALLSGLGIISKLLETPLTLMEKILKLHNI